MGLGVAVAMTRGSGTLEPGVKGVGDVPGCTSSLCLRRSLDVPFGKAKGPGVKGESRGGWVAGSLRTSLLDCVFAAFVCYTSADVVIAVVPTGTPAVRERPLLFRGPPLAGRASWSEPRASGQAEGSGGAGQVRRAARGGRGAAPGLGWTPPRGPRPAGREVEEVVAGPPSSWRRVRRLRARGESAGDEKREGGRGDDGGAGGASINRPWRRWGRQARG